jgi:hypothetical protein
MIRHCYLLNQLAEEYFLTAALLSILRSLKKYIVTSYVFKYLLAFLVLGPLITWYHDINLFLYQLDSLLASNS